MVPVTAHATGTHQDGKEYVTNYLVQHVIWYWWWNLCTAIYCGM